MEARQFPAGESPCVTLGADAGTEETFIGVDVADSVEEFLVKQGGFYGGSAGVEERAEFGERDVERFFAWALEAFFGLYLGDIQYGESSEAAGIDEANFAAIVEGEDGVGVGRHGDVGL